MTAGQTTRALGYIRVSDKKSADSGLSLADQEKAIHAACGQQGWECVGVRVEPGKSAWKENTRPVFNGMLAEAKKPDRDFNCIVVLNLSRFSRNTIRQEVAIADLAKVGVRVHAIAQPLDDSPISKMVRTIIAATNELSSETTSENVKRTMKENATQGWWNGGNAPFGYRAIEVERKGSRIKKRLEIDPAESEVVRKLYGLYLEGDESGKRLGVKALCDYLNSNGFRTRRGARFGIGPVHAILTNETYRGQFRYNKGNSREKTARDASEHIVVEVPAIIDAARFELVQQTLQSRNPKVTPPRIVTGDTLLTPVLRHATCQGSMTMATGTSGTGKRYTYYACSKTHREGKSVCPGERVSMPWLDQVVTESVIANVLSADHIRDVIFRLEARRAKDIAEKDGRLNALRSELSAAQTALANLLRLVETGVLSADDPALAPRLETLKQKRDIAAAAMNRIGAPGSTGQKVDDAMIVAFTQLIATQLRLGPITFRRNYLEAIIGDITVSKEKVVIRGRSDAIEAAVLASGAVPPAVRGFVRGWRARRDSNS